MLPYRRMLLIQSIVIAVLIGMAVSLFWTSPTNGDFWWFDASRHAMNGVFLYDFVFQGGLLHPIEFAQDYYRRYPAINIGFYPPFFYASSVPFLAIFGTSHAVSQGVVILYVFLLSLSIYYLCLRSTSTIVALSAATCITMLPEMALWARQVQLDIPAIALLVITAVTLVKHLETGTRNTLFATTIALGLAILTRAQAVCVLPAVMFFLFFWKYEQRPSLKVRLIALLPLVILALPSIAMVAYFSKINQSQVAKMPGMPDLFSIENWTWYAYSLPEQMGWPALIFSTLGLTFIAFPKARKALPITAIVAATFCLSSWILFSLISNKEPRFNLPSVPFFLLFSVFTWYALLPVVTRIVTPFLAMWLLYQAVAVNQVPTVVGFKEATQIAQKITPLNSNVLISAHRDGSFIYNMRTIGNRSDIGVRRADKIFVEISIRREFGIKDLNLSQNALLELLRKENITTIVMQEGYLSDQETMQNFQMLLSSKKHFKKLKTVDLRGSTRLDERELVIYSRN